jgi:cyclic beta-1,2-glucan synthetase
VLYDRIESAGNKLFRRVYIMNNINGILMDLGVFVLFIFIFLFILWLLLKRTSTSNRLNTQDVLLSGEELEKHAQIKAREHRITSQPKYQTWPVNQLNANYDVIISVYKELNDDIQKKRPVPPAAEWLLDNFYIIEEQVKALRRDLNKKTFLQLPVLKNGDLKGQARIFAIAIEIISHTDGQIDDKVILDYLNAYQTQNILFDREIWAMPLVIRLALIEKIRFLSEGIKKTKNNWYKADRTYKQWLENDEEVHKQFLITFKENLNRMEEINPSYIEHLLYNIRRSGKSNVNVLRIMDNVLKKFGTTTEKIANKEHNYQSVKTVSIGNCITSLHFMTTMDWADLFENASYVEKILVQDPLNIYHEMDVDTRNHYHGKIQELAARFKVSELYLAQKVLDLANQALEATPQEKRNDPVEKRTWHVGYYLLGKGLKVLEDSQEKKVEVIERIRKFVLNKPEVIYFTSIIVLTALIIGIGIRFIFMTTETNQLILSLILSLVLLIPASEIALTAVNWIICKAIKPTVFPKMSLKNGIPKNLSTIVATPTLLSDESTVEELLARMESNYLTNREENLYFVLIGAYADSQSTNIKNAKMIVEKTMAGIKKLNEKYAKGSSDKFYFFHRRSLYNEENSKWFGWERKRGALLEFNDMLLGAKDTSFGYFSASLNHLSNVKYIITLDSDTILPIGMAKKMIGSMAHPLNCPVINRKRGMVVEGYGLMQPRIQVELESSNKTLFSRIFAGQGGLDPYANAISDVYQDLFGEGSYTGKGIYDLKVFQSVLKNTIPENTVLSHDLLEGSYVRTGLVSDLKLMDAHPSQYNGAASRTFRWTRGDWQLLPYLYRKIRNAKNELLDNPLSTLSKWKILDNLRRSLVAPSLMVLLALSFSILPGNILFWITLFLLPQSVPLLIGLVHSLVHVRPIIRRIKRDKPIIIGSKAEIYQLILNIIFLPYNAWLMIKAILITLNRVYITNKNLLEWVTSAELEKKQKNSLKSYIINMKSSLISAAILFILIELFKPELMPLGVFCLLIWSIAPYVGYKISKEPKKTEVKVTEQEILELGRMSRKTWRYFEEFANSKNHYLAPDNYQVYPARGLAYRTSPTNIGLGLLATLSARDFGYIGTNEMLEQLEKTINTIESMDKWNGHLFNWYNTNTLKTLEPAYVSTVDSGNFAGYLITLAQGLKGYLDKPFIDEQYLKGIKDTINCIGEEGRVACQKYFDYLATEGENITFPNGFKKALKEISSVCGLHDSKKTFWIYKVENMLQKFDGEIQEFLPGKSLLDGFSKEFMKLKETEELILLLDLNPKLKDLSEYYIQLESKLNALMDFLQKSKSEKLKKNLPELEELAFKLINTKARVAEFLSRYQKLIGRIEVIYYDMKFLPLYDKKKQLFSIGFNFEDKKLTNSYYDLLASEARLTSYIAIAKGEIPVTHWFKMGRALTVVGRYKGLVSWTGTMFEYLMPLLVMRNYKHTLLDETYSFAIKSQKKYAKMRNMPWGISESAFNLLDRNQEYQYKAIGVPWLGLKRGLIEDAVTTPYATCLALMVDPRGAIDNLRLLKEEGLEGRYGYYEAADYTKERLGSEPSHHIIKSFMAHHQGMSLLALNNFLNNNIMQVRFHQEPAMDAARLLLQEKVPGNILITKTHKEKIVPYKDDNIKEKRTIRTYHVPNQELPKAHILTNGNYSIMLTDRGTGYSKNKLMAVTRWRMDNSFDSYGMFFYLKNLDTDAIWSATYAPLNIRPDFYEVTFMADKAIYLRRDGDIETKTEVLAASGENAEIRRISITNKGEKTCNIEVTSYSEIVLATQDADEYHPAFSNLFIETEYNKDLNCLVGSRRPKSKLDKSTWIGHSAVLEGSSAGELQYETDRMKWIGRGRNLKNSLAMLSGKPLSNTTGPVLDPVMSLRLKVSIEPGKTAKISFITTVAESNEYLLSKIEKYSSSDRIEGAFNLAQVRSSLEMKYLNMKEEEEYLYQNLLSDILFVSPLRDKNQKQIMENIKGQSSLWRYSISGDLPIILVVLNKNNQMRLLTELLKVQEYCHLLDIIVDLVILNEEEYAYDSPLNQLISDIVLSSQTHDYSSRKQHVFVLDRSKVLEEDIPLLYAVSRLVFKGDEGNIRDQLKREKNRLLPELMDFDAVANSTKENNVDDPELPSLIYFNDLGGFNEKGDEYIIKLDNEKVTPAPWINVITNDKFGFLVSESGSGYTWSENSRENKLTPWSNDPVCDPPGELLYIRDEETGSVWSPTPSPIREKEPYIIHHGFGYSRFEHNSHEIRQSLNQFVPIDESVKLSLLSLMNSSDKKKKLKVTYYIKPVLGVIRKNTILHIRTKLDDSGGILLENPYNEDFRGEICFVDASIKERTVTNDGKEFFGSGNTVFPDSLKRKELSGNMDMVTDPCGAIQVEVVLEPNEKREIVFQLGVGKDSMEIQNLMEKYRSVENARLALTKVREFWVEKLQTVQISTPAKSMDLMLNGWLQYQLIASRLWARAGFYQAGGAFGFRDQLQDCLSIASIWPEAARSQILLHGKHQYVEGDVQHWWHEPSNKGVRTRFSDDRLWLPYVTAEYIRITGDSSILYEELPFLIEDVLKENEDDRYGNPRVSEETATLYEHCLRAIEVSLKFGKHGLPLMGSGDWNDGMNEVGNRGSGESVWLGWFLISVLNVFAPICKQMGDNHLEEKYIGTMRNISGAIEKDAWDGKWYRRAYFDNGMALGSDQNNDCKIDSISQSWAVISGQGQPGRAKEAMNSMENYLISREDGLMKLLTPPFDKGKEEPGYIKGYVPGTRENGGQYTHAAAWAIMAFAKLGNGNKALDLFELLNPVNLTNNYREYSRYKVEPYVMAADVYSIYPHIGRGGWSWYTGAAGWMHRAGLESILGFQKNGDTIVIDPCIPSHWKEYEISYRYKSSNYHIIIKNPKCKTKGVVQLSVDGITLEGNVLPLKDDWTLHQVEVILV